MSFAGVDYCSRTVRCVEGACVCVKHFLAKGKGPISSRTGSWKPRADNTPTDTLKCMIVLRSPMSFAGVECYSRTVRHVEDACVCVKHLLAAANDLLERTRAVL